MSIKKLSIYFIAFLGLLSGSCQQDLYVLGGTNQTITVAVEDTIHQVRLLPREKKVKLYRHRQYHYYYGNQLASAEGDYIGRVLHGEYTCFTRRKELVLKGYYREGLKDGIWKSWYPNGNLYVTQEWDKGQKDGAFRVYQPDGRFKEKGNYKNGELSGSRVSYFDNGKVRLTETYRRDILHGPYREYYPDGTLKIAAKYKEGELHGPYRLYNEAGELQEILRYRNGELKEKKQKEETEGAAGAEGGEMNREGEEVRQKKRFLFFKKKEKAAETENMPEENQAEVPEQGI